MIPRLVLDTNVIISGALFGGVPRQLLETIIDHRASLYISQEIILELSEVLQRPKFKGSALFNALLIADILEISSLVKPVRNAEFSVPDGDDNIIVDCAIAAKADYIVTGDLEFMACGAIAGIQIVSPRKMLGILLSK